ncbi:hypothetical protein XENOCAPTIV_002783, partial [Xenoophorus captivus]
ERDEDIEVEDPEEEEDNEDDDGHDHGGEYEEDREDMRINMGSDGECDELDDLPCSCGNQWKGPISRKPSQTSVYLQEWDIPFEQLDLGELIGKVFCLCVMFMVSLLPKPLVQRENKLRLPHGWICYLAPEIVCKMSPGNNEDRLPFSTAADVYAFGTIWYELQARDWPITNQPIEATIWQVGSGEGIKKVLGEISLGKEVTVSRHQHS